MTLRKQTEPGQRGRVDVAVDESAINHDGSPGQAPAVESGQPFYGVYNVHLTLG